MTLFQALLIALIGYLGSIYGTFLFGTVGGWNGIGRPIVAGAIGFPLWRHFGALVPYLIFAMLLLTFCKMPFSSRM